MVIKQDSPLTTRCEIIFLAEMAYIKPETGLRIYNYIHIKTVWLDIHVLISRCFFFQIKTLNTSIQYTEWRRLCQGDYFLEYPKNWNRWDNFTWMI